MTGPSPRRILRRAQLDERTCRMICPIAAGMVGVCLTAIGIIQVVLRPHHGHTIADDLLSFDSLLFLVATLSSYFALRVQSVARVHWLERVADATFIVAMTILSLACFVVTYWMQR